MSGGQRARHFSRTYSLERETILNKFGYLEDGAMPWSSRAPPDGGFAGGKSPQKSSLRRRRHPPGSGARTALSRRGCEVSIGRLGLSQLAPCPPARAQYRAPPRAPSDGLFPRNARVPGGQHNFLRRRPMRDDDDFRQPVGCNRHLRYIGSRARRGCRFLMRTAAEQCNRYECKKSCNSR
jgi:hypothetical protein